MKLQNTLTILMVTLAHYAFSQKIVERTISVAHQKSINLQFNQADLIKITGWDKKEIQFKASIDLNGGTLNDSLHLFFEEGNEEIQIYSQIDKSFKHWMSKRNYTEEDGRNYYWGKNEKFIISEILYELKIPKELITQLKTINGDIELKNLDNSLTAKTINGFIDLDWNPETGAYFEMKTINGELYSNLENIEFTNKKEHPIVGYPLKGTYKSGKTPVMLETINGNIFLRKR
ncbi:hypothetical protein [Flexithrix dorotheae]|uniref:hypothetical protein n=1 Tax=Flexithrix dorotheae TaxID=70993 RepID=UPI0003641FC9|nr:hypothetical protein [Flexithrix dorotheae]